MADPVLHIKDSYYFEVPKMLYPSARDSRKEFPDVWISLDPDFQDWEFHRLYESLQAADAGLPPHDAAHHDWHHWVHADHANFAKPFDVFLDEKYQAHQARFNEWRSAQVEQARTKKDEAVEEKAEALTYGDYLKTVEGEDQPYVEFLKLRNTEDFQEAWTQIKTRAGDVKEWKEDPSVGEWSQAKLDAYNGHLSGKILIPQPFGTLKNLYEPDSGFCLSKYMVLELLIGLVLFVVFRNLAARVTAGGPPRGYLWNLLESFLLFIRNDIVRPSLGGHHEEHPKHEQEHGHEFGSPYAEHGQALTAHGKPDDGHGHNDHKHSPAHGAHAHAAVHHGPDDATRLLPLFWTIFFFVLGCNLFGMLPWLGAPSSSFSVTTGLALVTLVVGIACGIQKFGLLGYLGNQIPSMDLPLYIAVIVKPLVYAIEVMGLLIKHGVLAIRLLANMVAGHLVILGIMGVAFGATAALNFSDPNTPSWQWPIAATIAVVASTLFSLLELFVAFLQAYIFTFLSALFIGAAIHKH